MPNPNEGAPCVLIALPSGLRILVAVSSTTLPVAASTLSSSRTFSSKFVGTEGASAVLPSNEMSGAFPLIAASVLAYDSLKIASNALSIVSVRTKVPLTMATPSTTASAVSEARNLRPASPLSATRITSA